jgi:hypothetical protein
VAISPKNHLKIKDIYFHIAEILSKKWNFLPENGKIERGESEGRGQATSDEATEVRRDGGTEGRRDLSLRIANQLLRISFCESVFAN